MLTIEVARWAYCQGDVFKPDVYGVTTNRFTLFERDKKAMSYAFWKHLQKRKAFWKTFDLLETIRKERLEIARREQRWLETKNLLS